MKKCYTLLWLLQLCVAGFAQNGSDLTISTTGNSNLKIRFNGTRYTLQDRSATFQNLTAGSYPLIIFQMQKKSNGGVEYTEVFNNTITLTAGKHLEVTVLRFGKTAWDEGAIEKEDWSDGYNANPIGSRNGNNGGIEPATNQQFERMKTTLGNEYNTDSKLVLAKSIIKNNPVNTLQIKEIAEMFYDESRKLEWIKYAYDFCTDKNSYFTLEDIFYSSDKKKSLRDFLNSK